MQNQQRSLRTQSLQQRKNNFLCVVIKTRFVVKLIVGLGNPGPKYAKTRHNVGFFVADALHQVLGLPEFREKFSGYYTKGSAWGEEIALLKPMTFMNESGKSVQAAIAFFHIDLNSELLVLHDELDLPLGEVRFKQGGGHAGHNGLRSIFSVSSQHFARVRLGIGRPPSTFRGSVADFVLQPFDSNEWNVVDTMIEQAQSAIKLWVTQGSAIAMNQTNTRSKS